MYDKFPIDEDPRGRGRGRRSHHGDHHGHGSMTRGDEERGRGRPPFKRGHGRGFGGDERMGSFFGRGGRAGRGDVRSAILALLGEAPMHGYQIIGELAERTGGVWKLSPGSVYPTLQHMEDEGLLRHEQSEGRNVFSLTDAGREALAARAGRPAPWDEVGATLDAGLFELKDIVGQVAVAVRQIAKVGTPAQLDTAKALLAETRRGLYRILAEDPAPEEGADTPPS
jgi:DNA-binding PadR family transcriptional regulator